MTHTARAYPGFRSLKRLGVLLLLLFREKSEKVSCPRTQMQHNAPESSALTTRPPRHPHDVSKLDHFFYQGTLVVLNKIEKRLTIRQHFNVGRRRGKRRGETDLQSQDKRFLQDLQNVLIFELLSSKHQNFTDMLSFCLGQSFLFL